MLLPGTHMIRPASGTETSRLAWHRPCTDARLMPIASCQYCQAAIVDYSSVVDVRGEIFCCRNCLVASHAHGSRPVTPPDLPACARCTCAIFETDSLVERQAQRYCCYNCAAAAIHGSRLVAA